MTSKLKKLLFLTCLLITVFAATHLALAAELNLGLNYGAGTGLGAEDPRIIVANVIRIALGFLGIIAVGLIIYAGWLWLTAAGEWEKVEKAKKILIGAIIGLIIILSAFAIASFILSQFLGATGGGESGGGGGPPPGGGGTDYGTAVRGTSPRDGDDMLPQNTAAMFLFTNGIEVRPDVPLNYNPKIDPFRSDNSDHIFKSQKFVLVKPAEAAFAPDPANAAALNNNFKLEKIANINKLDYGETLLPAAAEIIGARSLEQGQVVYKFISNENCADGTPNCLPKWSKFRATINGQGGIWSIGNKRYECKPGNICQFVFSTGEVIDRTAPRSGLAPAQMCQDDGHLKLGANTVTGWGSDDWSIAFLAFKQRQIPDDVEDKLAAPGGLAPGTGQKFQQADYKYDTRAMKAGDEYKFTVYAEDLAGHSASSSFTTTIKPGHCCNGEQDGNETDIDCGGDCLACFGGPCNKIEPNQCGANQANCDDNLCSTFFCDCQSINGCRCGRKPIIFDVSPLGGFCSADHNTFCRADKDCSDVSKGRCNADTPNGAPDNYVTIKGKYFGAVKSLFENVLTNVDFEQGAVGAVPVDWTSRRQKNSTVGITRAEKKSGAQSVLIHQAPNQDFPGVCSQSLCENLKDVPGVNCSWQASKQCKFPAADEKHSAPATYKEGEKLVWPNSNNVMAAKLVYNVSALGWQTGEKYVVKFNYKGHNAGPITLRLAFDIEWPEQCILISSLRGQEICAASNDNQPGFFPTCLDQPGICCVQGPAQRKCYGKIDLQPVPAGAYSDWQTYRAAFTYTEEMKKLLTKEGQLKNEIGLTVGFYPTGAQGTDFYIDDFTVAKLPSQGDVMFLGEEPDPNPTDNQAAIFPSELNPNCLSNWQDDQIIVLVPRGAVDGPIKVVAENGLADTTNDDRGPVLKNFDVNNIKRPGVCLAQNNTANTLNVCYHKPCGFLNDQINLQGNAFSARGPSAVLFGNLTSSIAAAKMSGGGNTSVDAVVPNLKEGGTSVFTEVNKVNSNYLAFLVKDDPTLYPVINYIDPDEGPAGQYITIYGSNFKTYVQGTSRVQFYWEGDPSKLIEADTDFPPDCKNDWWHDTYIVVKVPKVSVAGAYYKVIVTNSIPRPTKKPADFHINNDSLKPGLCKLNPNNGRVGRSVIASGERFGTDANKVEYYNNKSDTVFTVNKPWTDKKVSSNVPLGAVTGPVKVIDKDGTVSNSLPFRVQKCSVNTECNIADKEECCGDGTYWPGICRAKDAQGKSTCELGSPTACGFGWSFTTNAGDCAADQELCPVPGSYQSPGGNCKQRHCCAKSQCNKLTGQCSACSKNKPDQCGDSQCCSCGGCKDLNGDGKTECSDAESCSGYGGAAQSCFGQTCPNSPGQCSTRPAVGTIDTGVKCGSDACKELKICQGASNSNLCSYINNSANTNINNKCKKNGATCSLPKTLRDTIGNKDVTVKCGLVDNKNVWYYDSNQTCVDTYTKSIDKTKCLGAVCEICSAGFICQADGLAGICATNANICPVGSKCSNAAPYKCTKTDSGGCECCCEIRQNTPAGNNPGCCTGLKCSGTCGADMIDDNAGFGQCTGCTVAGDQVASNAKCDCTGASGKFCNMAGAGGLGTCLDCASLTNAAACSSEGVGACCVDAMNKNACRGGTDTFPNNGANYCAYYSCGAGAQANQCQTKQKTGDYKTADCGKNCKSGLGQSCDGNAAAAGCQADETKCATDLTCDQDTCKCAPNNNSDGTLCKINSLPACSVGADSCAASYACLNKNSADCRCCCNPNDKTVSPDKIVDGVTLKCIANQAPCDTANRGLYCGCAKDSQCGAVASGCGEDTCCHARPSVIDPTVPANNAVKVCRNALIQATFNQPMEINTFAGNVIVAGDYGASQCPAGTQYLTAVYKPTVFARVKFWLAKLPLVNKLFASPARALDGNFCSVQGSVSGLIKTDIHGVKTTALEFKLQKVLEPNKKYYVIIKGDSDITDTISNGVLSQAGIGLVQTSAEVFNGVTFKGKIWSFTTMGELAANNGVCEIDHAEIMPASYLFQTNKNDVNDDNANNKGAFDRIKDSDLVYRAVARAVDGSALNSLAGVYSWTWGWDSAAKTIFNFVLPSGGSLLYNENLLRAEPTVTEGKSIIKATATLTPGQGVGGPFTAAANAYLMVCSNPWPPLKNNGTWASWGDERGNCRATPTASCANTNFEIYYCRDAGGAGTADDLPAILSDTTVIRGTNLKCRSNNLNCDNGTGSCVSKAKGDTCGDGSGKCDYKVIGSCSETAAINSGCSNNTGTCQIEILKELYFFREELPDATKMILATTTNDEIKHGGKAGLTWSAITVPAGQTLDKYQVYHGTVSGKYTDSVAASNIGTDLNPQIISGLSNGRKYYFAVTAKYKSGVESAYSNETTAIPADTWAPITPGGLAGTAAAGSASLSWQANTDDTASYKVYYGASKDVAGNIIYGASVSVSKSKCSAGKCGISIGSLSAGVTYHFAVSAIDGYKNESNKSAGISLIIK